MIENIKSTCELKIDTNFQKLKGIYSLVNDKLGIYDDRVQNIEKILSEKIHYIKNKKDQDGSKLLDNLIDKLNSQLGELQTKCSNLELE